MLGPTSLAFCGNSSGSLRKAFESDPPGMRVSAAASRTVPGYVRYGVGNVGSVDWQRRRWRWHGVGDVGDGVFGDGISYVGASVVNG
jgi:hypothetical protein